MARAKKVLHAPPSLLYCTLLVLFVYLLTLFIYSTSVHSALSAAFCTSAFDPSPTIAPFSAE